MGRLAPALATSTAAAAAPPAVIAIAVCARLFVAGVWLSLFFLSVCDLHFDKCVMMHDVHW
jgi:hypothetical protein